jgi:F-type H+-transporting ATPase subunit gamma
MQRAEENIDSLLENLSREFHRLRQSSIDEELFDLVVGFEAMT